MTETFDSRVGERPTEWHAGDVILDLYRVAGVLGEGGMGQVYRVLHTGWNLDLAVKRPRAQFFRTESDKKTFSREAETWINLGLHPHIVSCYYVRELSGIPTVFAEFVQGGSLQEWIRSGRLYKGGPEESLERILDIAIQFAWGLNYAHEEGVVHQDVKPANVMMTFEGIAKVTDFGLAQALGRSRGAGVPASGGSAVVSYGGMTQAYCSPEQANQLPLSRKTDIWSWAVSVLEMFRGELTWLSGEVAAEALEEYLSDGPESWAVPMPASVAELLRSCFQPAPDRPHDALELSFSLLVIYSQIIGRSYHRQIPKAPKLIADGLNNRAVSLLDLGKNDEAERLWSEALRIQPHHPEATYNRGLIHWRAGRLNDEMLIGAMEEVRSSHESGWIDDYLLGLVYLERDDAEAAVEILQNIEAEHGEVREVSAALAEARERLPESRRLSRTFPGHNGLVLSVSLSRDSRYALSGGSDGAMKLWDCETGRCLHTFQGHIGWVHKVAFSPDGRHAISNDHHDLRLWDNESGDCLLKFSAYRPAESYSLSINLISLSHDGRYALASGRGGGATDNLSIGLWECETGRCLRTFEGHTDRVISAALSPDEQYVMSSSADATLKLWEVGTGGCVRTYLGHKSGVAAFDLSSDWKYLLSGSWDMTLKLWEVWTGRCLNTAAGHTSPVASVSLSADGRYALSGGGGLLDGRSPAGDSTMRFWDMKTGQCLGSRSHRSGPTEVSLSADVRHALSGNGRKVTLWDLTAGAYLAPFVLSRIVATEAAARAESIYERSMVSAREAFQREDFVAALQSLRQARSQPGHQRSAEAVDMWTALYRRLPRTELRGGWEKDTFKGHRAGVNAVCPSRDGLFALSGSTDNTLKLWDCKTGSSLHTFGGHEHSVNSVDLSLDGRLALSGSSDRTLKLWDIETGRCLRTFEGHGDTVESVAFGRDGRLALSGARDEKLMLWDTQTGRRLRTFEGHTYGVESVCLSPDGKYALSGSSDNTLKLWECETGRCVHTFEGHDKAVTSVSVTQDWSYVLSSSGDKTLKLWRVETGECLRTFEGHARVVTSACLSLDGRYVLSGGYDMVLKLWEVATGRCVRTFDGHTLAVRAVNLSRDLRYALSCGLDRTLKLWVLDWEMEERRKADWDEGARPYLEQFLLEHSRQAPTPKRGVLKRLIPAFQPLRQAVTCTEKDFRGLLDLLESVGYGWLRPGGVRNELEKAGVSWSEGLHAPTSNEGTLGAVTTLHAAWQCPHCGAGHLQKPDRCSQCYSPNTPANSASERTGVISTADDLIKRKEWLKAAQLLTKHVAEVPPDWHPIKILPDLYEGYFWSSEEFISFVDYYRGELLKQKKSVIWVDGSYSKGYFLLAYIAAEHGDYSEALRLIDKGLALEPDHPQLLNEKAFILGGQRRFEESLTYYWRAVKARPWIPSSVKGRSYRGQGVVLIDLGRLNEAEEALKRSLMFDPDNEIALGEIEFINQLRHERNNY